MVNKSQIIVKGLSFFFFGTFLNTAPNTQPKLVVVISVDQMREDFFDRFGDLFTGGLKYLLEEGVYFSEAFHDHAVSVTGPGHFSIGSGRYPGPVGILSNDWYDRQTGSYNYCVQDNEATGLGTDYQNISYRNINATALGDWIKHKTPNSKVYSISSKDRSAVFMGGKNPTGVFWLDNRTGQYITTDYYMKRYPRWLKKFNRSKPLDKYFGTEWKRSINDLSQYDMRCRKDNYPGEEMSKKFNGRTFPHTLQKPDKGREPIYEDLWNFPFLDEVLLDLAKVIIDKESLGEDSSTDLLNIGLSMSDAVGHSFGPHSQEVMEMFVMLDAYLEEFFNFLDRNIGMEHVLVALTSDHGSGYLPEYAKELGLGGGRYGNNWKKELLELNRELSREFGEGSYIEAFSAGAIFYSHHLMRAKGLSRKDIDSVVIPYIEKLDMVDGVIIRSKLESGDNLTDLERLYKNSFHQDKSGDLHVIPKPHWISKTSSGASHGSPYEWDRHVPMVFAGCNLKPALVEEKVRTVDFAPTIGRLLNLEIPGDVDGKPLNLVRD
jgi:predicted AlkP superfamily pyrophosphatase or phosphodiesterase